MGFNSKYVEITLDKPRRILFDMNAMCEFEKVTGKNFFEFSSNASKMSASDLRAFLWACLIHEDKNLTIEEVGQMINGENIEAISQSLIKAQVLNTPETSKDEQRPLV